jgi:polyphenol oxidase
LKLSADGVAYYTGEPVAGFVYGVGDRNLDPAQGLRAFAQRAGLPQPASVVQVHGDRILAAAEAGESLSCEADAVSVEAGEAALIRIADCVPVLLLDPHNRRGIAVHAGWRGTYAGIATRAAEQLGRAGTDAAGPVDCSRLVAYIGPAIGPCCYRIGSDLAEKFQSRFGSGDWLSWREEHPYVDLPGLNAEQLRASGVRNITIERRCTHDHADLHSFRRDGEASGRMAAFIFALPR